MNATLDPKAIFFAALDRASPDELERYLDEACLGNVELRGRVEQLLRAHQQAGKFLGGQASAEATTDLSAHQHLGTLIGPYKLLEQIGEGGMGLVYMAEQQQPVRRLVALKIIKPGMDTKQVIARFDAERQALAMMDHPNIARIYDAGTVGQSTKSEARSTKQTQNSNQKIKNEESVPVSDIGASNLEFVSDFDFRASNLNSASPYFVMELVRGIPLNEFADQKRVTLRERLSLFIQVCQAIQHAHQKGIIHRDLKPTNVLVTIADTVPVPKVIDFGIAKALGPSLTDHTLHTGFAQLIGTPLYMSPEQAEMNQFGVDTRSDVYSLGVILYELLTGTTPFDKETLTKVGFDEMRRIIREEEPETVSARIARTRRVGPARAASAGPPADKKANTRRWAGAALVPPYSELDWIVARALEKDRTRRYESPSALAADIQRYLSDEPVLACPPTTMYRFQKFARKHQPALVTAATIAACLLLGTTVSAWQAVRATTAEAQASANEQRAKTERDEVKVLADKLAVKEQQLQRTLYSAHMNLARHAWEAGGIDQVEELLQQHRSKAGEPDLRGFEWHYLNRLCNSSLRTLRGHTYYVNTAAYSPDGKRLASASVDKTVRVWDTSTGKELLTFKGHTGEVRGVAFSPDGKHVASCTGGSRPGGGGTPEGRGLKVWDVQTGEELWHVHEVWDHVAYSPDGKRLATCFYGDRSSPSNRVKIRDAQTGQELQSWKAHDDYMSDLAFSPDGKRLASAADDQTLKIWDAQTGQESLSLKGDGVSFSPDGKRLASDGKVWDAQTGEKLLSLTNVGADLVFSPDGKHLVSSSHLRDRTVRIFDAQTGQEVRVIRGGGTTAIYSPDSRHLATCSVEGSADYSVKIWDAQKDQDSLTVKGTRGLSVAISPDSRYVATHVENSVQLWDARTGKPALTLKGHTTPLVGIAFSADGRRIASCGRSGPGPNDITEFKIWDAQTGQELLSIKDERDVRAIAFSPDSKRLASPSKVWDAATGRELISFDVGGRGFGNQVTFSPDGKYLATGGFVGGLNEVVNEVKVWNAQSGELVRAFPGGGQGVAFSPDGKRLASSVMRPEVKVLVWDVESGREIYTVKGGGYGVAFSSDGKRLASGGKIWDAESGQELLSLQGGGYGIVFSPNGHFLVSASFSDVKIWNATPLPEKP